MTGTPPPLQRRMFGRPTTRSGKRSFKALLWFAVAMGVFFVVGTTVLIAVRALDSDPLTIAWYGVMFAMLGVAGLLALASLAFALHAAIRQGDRALVLLVPVFVGILVAFFAIGEALGHDEPGDDDAEGHASSHSDVSV